MLKKQFIKMFVVGSVALIVSCGGGTSSETGSEDKAFSGMLDTISVARGTAAAVTMKNIYSAQIAFQMAGYVDEDNDGRGEFGTIDELCGNVEVVEGVSLSLLPSDNYENHNGYSYEVILSDDIDECENEWRAVATPKNSKGKIYSIDQTGIVKTEPAE